ncbi:MAG: polyphosphate kinase 1 [Olsenella sp.]|nr:polyphosphate kinase 1 [Olsenella sp.]
MSKETKANEQTDAPEGAAKKHHKYSDFTYTQNREISWLAFDNRVLDEAADETVPLYERLKFCAIFASNLDEWFMIRIGGLTELAALKRQPKDNRSNQTPAEQLESVFSVLPGYLRRQQDTFHALEAALAKKGVVRVGTSELSEDDLAAISGVWNGSIAPLVSPLIIDPRHPFPNLRNTQLYVICSLDTGDESGLLGMVEVPSSVPRLIELPSAEGQFRYTLVEDVIRRRLAGVFGSYVPTSSATIRITRNADIDPDGEGVEEEEDYRKHMKKVLRRRQHLQPIRLEVQGEVSDKHLAFLTKELDLEPNRVFRLDMPLEMSHVYAVEDHIPEARRAELTFEPFEPQLSPMVAPGVPMRDQVRDHDILLFYPYESMAPLLDLLREASTDDACIAIKITLYRVAKQSKLCESLIAAAENGKDVTVLMELRARFDEANNIAWAERLEAAGITVIYGSEGFKCHSKICQVTYHDADGVSHITCLGTGNFNEKTARLYSDFMLLTADAGIGADGNAFFRNLTLGNLAGSYDYLAVAPAGLKPMVMRGIDREISRARGGQPARVFLKMNSLTDRDVIDKLAEAAQAGVEVSMIIRGICCLLPGVKGKTEGIEVHQIVGRLLEHARVYAFGEDIDTLYLSSADMMTRNTERRVEIAYPVIDPTCREMVMQYMNLQLIDNVKARVLSPSGVWEHVIPDEGEEAINSQEILIALAYKRADEASDESRKPLSSLSAMLTHIPADVEDRMLFSSGSPDADEPVHRVDTSASQATAARPVRVRKAAARTPEADTPQSQGKGRVGTALGLIGRGLKTLIFGDGER